MAASSGTCAECSGILSKEWKFCTYCGFKLYGKFSLILQFVFNNGYYFCFLTKDIELVSHTHGPVPDLQLLYKPILIILLYRLGKGSD